MDKAKRSGKNKAAIPVGRTRGGEKVTELVLKLLHLHGVLYSHGQKITEPVGQTPARWQVLGAIEGESLTVSQIARRMGITRQEVQRVANILREEGLVDFVENPDHIKSPKIELTTEGSRVLGEINQKQAEWANEIAKHVGLGETSNVCETLDRFLKALEKTETEVF